MLKNSVPNEYIGVDEPFITYLLGAAYSHELTTALALHSATVSLRISRYCFKFHTTLFPFFYYKLIARSWIMERNSITKNFLTNVRTITSALIEQMRISAQRGQNFSNRYLYRVREREAKKVIEKVFWFASS